MVRIAVLVSGGGTNLQALLDAERKGILASGKIVLVVADREGCKALERAKAHEVPSLLLDKKTLGKAEFEKELGEALEENGIGLVVLAGFLSILSEDFCRRFEKRMINVHPSLIPSFSGKGFYGLKVHEAALLRGVKVTGATVHIVDDVPDGGRILMQKAVEVRDDDTPETLQRRVMEQAEWIILPQAAEIMCRTIDGAKENTL